MILPETKPSITSIEVKEMNMKKLFNYVYNNGPVSKQELAYNLSLSIPTVNLYLRNYEEANIIVQEGTFDSTGGRKAAAYKCNSSHIFSVGVYITRFFFIITIINFIGEEIFSRKTKKTFELSETYGREINQQIDEAISSSQIDPAKIYGVGFSIPGTIEKSNDHYTVLFSGTLSDKSWSFEVIGKFCKYPYIVDNDAYFGSYVEARIDNFESNFAFLNIASGVGGAIFIDGKHFSNQHETTAKFGHMIIQPNGNLCNCGRKGCLQTYISTDVLTDNLNISLEQFFTDLKYNKDYQEKFNRYLDYLCIGISNLRLILGLDVVVAGEIIEYLASYEDIILKKLSDLDVFDSERYFRFTKNKKENSSCKGAALKIVSEYIATI
ncbi:MAG: ROK family transcriptional regulator [Saccharofermentanales bacterium]|jgi:N-acetylglucosamine repressor